MACDAGDELSNSAPIMPFSLFLPEEELPLYALLVQGKSHDCLCFLFYFGHQEAYGQMCGPIKDLFGQQFGLRVTCSFRLLCKIHNPFRMCTSLLPSYCSANSYYCFIVP